MVKDEQLRDTLSVWPDFPGSVPWPEFRDVFDITLTDVSRRGELRVHVDPRYRLRSPSTKGHEDFQWSRFRRRRYRHQERPRNRLLSEDRDGNGGMVDSGISVQEVRCRDVYRHRVPKWRNEGVSTDTRLPGPGAVPIPFLVPTDRRISTVIGREVGGPRGQFSINGCLSTTLP